MNEKREMTKGNEGNEGFKKSISIVVFFAAFCKRFLRSIRVNSRDSRADTLQRFNDLGL